MTQKPEPDDRALEALFAAERDARTSPSASFLERIEADALNVQRSFAETKAPRRSGVRFLWPNWGAFAGLAACLVIGVGLGSGFSGQIGAFGDYYLSGGFVASEGVFPTDFDVLLTGDEG